MGPKGDRGDIGATGLRGEMGPVGPPGPRGFSAEGLGVVEGPEEGQENIAEDFASCEYSIHVVEIRPFCSVCYMFALLLLFQREKHLWLQEISSGFPPQTGSSSSRLPTLKQHVWDQTSSSPPDGQRGWTRRLVEQARQSLLIMFQCEKSSVSIIFSSAELMLEAHRKLWKAEADKDREAFDQKSNKLSIRQ
jgi:hypothetical protein